MDWILLLAWSLVVIGALGVLLPALPGVPVLFGGLWMLAWLDGYEKISVFTMSIIGALALVAWLVDIFGSYITAKKFGASKQALWGVVIGAIVGIFAGVVGLIIGPIIGGMIGEWMAHQDKTRATTVGLAAGLGFMLAFVVKIVLVIVMLVVFAYAYYF